MDLKRQGEISLMLLKSHLRKKGFEFSRNKMRELGDISQATGVPVEELKKFSKIILQELLDEMFVE